MRQTHDAAGRRLGLEIGSQQRFSLERPVIDPDVVYISVTLVKFNLKSISLPYEHVASRDGATYI